MRIALLSYEYPEETGFGGIGTYTWFHARALARLGHEVHVLAGATSHGLLRPETHDGVRVWRTLNRATSAVRLGLGLMRLWWTRERVRNAIDMWAAFRVLNRRHRFDVAEMPECGAEGFLVNRFADVPTVVRFHSPARLVMPFYDVLDRDHRWSGRIEELAIARATALSSSSRFLAGELGKIGVHRNAEIIHNGIDLDWFDGSIDDVAVEGLGIPADKPVVLFTGRLERRKGIYLCPPIVAEILERHDCAFVFAGSDMSGFVESRLKPALRGRALRGTLHVLGRLTPRDVRACVRRADVVFLPSLWESCPYSCLEAMAAGRAIVASNAGGFPELLQDRVNARVVTAGDTAGFVDALDELLRDARLRERLGAAARRAVETSLRDTDVARRALELYERAAR